MTEATEQIGQDFMIELLLAELIARTGDIAAFEAAADAGYQQLLKHAFQGGLDDSRQLDAISLAGSAREYAERVIADARQIAAKL